MKLIRLLLISTLILVSGNAIFAGTQITVAAAANVQYAMNELKAEFTKETGISVSVVIGSSGQLTSQIMEGAPYDVFVSADMMYPERLFREKLAVDSPKIYAWGSLVIWAMDKGLKLDKELKVLLKKRIKKIALANPRTAPYGAATVEALKKFGIYDKVKDKLVYGESISPTNQFIVSKAVEAGFTAKSVVLSPQMKGKGKWEEIAPDVYSPIQQGCVILNYGFKNHKHDSLKFFNFLFSKKAKNILMKYGYTVR